MIGNKFLARWKANGADKPTEATVVIIDKVRCPTGSGYNTDRYVVVDVEGKITVIEPICLVKQIDNIGEPILQR